MLPIEMLILHSVSWLQRLSGVRSELNSDRKQEETGKQAIEITSSTQLRTRNSSHEEDQLLLDEIADCRI